ncbi:MAG: hypothetical protein H0T62_03240 [Parachlamydiaceae bacterium]|nr:hypothetical protein [Parachlamydiaceae bacterium]
MNNNICEGNDIIFIRNDFAKMRPALDENGRIICPYNSVFFIKNDNVNKEKLDRLLDLDQGNGKNISSKTVNDVQSISGSCVCAEGEIFRPSQQSKLLGTNLSSKKITSVVDSEIKDNDNKDGSTDKSKKTRDSCCDNISSIISALGLITGIALAIFGGVVWTPICLGLGITLAALSVCVIVNTVYEYYSIQNP